MSWTTDLFISLGCLVGYLTGARAMFWLLTRMDQPRLTKMVHSHYQATHPERDLDKSRNARVLMAYGWLPLVIATTLVTIALGTYQYVTKPMVTPAEHAERKRRKRAEVEQAVADAERELEATQEPSGSWRRDDRPCHCLYCNGRAGVHGDEAVALHNARVLENINREEYH